MDSSFIGLIEELVPSFGRGVAETRRTREGLVRSLLAQRKWPQDGWDDATIELFLLELAGLDSNNFVGQCMVGEREGRVASNLVLRRHYRLSHGIGRSGDVAAVQPKAVGSSVMAKLLQYFVADALRLAGMFNVRCCVVLPVATGMALSLTLLTLRKQRPSSACWVLWPRVDQKSCPKAIELAGGRLKVISNQLQGDEVCCDVSALRGELESISVSEIFCVISTTSSFAPRAPDDVVAIARLCAEFDVPHVINNAYGVQSSKVAHVVAEAGRVGRVDAVVQSTDKNFLVPVGGSVVAGLEGHVDLVQEVSRSYPGRASVSPILDLFVTLLSLGRAGYKQYLIERKELFGYFRTRIKEVAEASGERLLDTPHNNISLAISLSGLAAKGIDPVKLGAIVYRRGASGHRVVVPRSASTVEGAGGEESVTGLVNVPWKDVTIAGAHLRSFGAHIDTYPTPYLAASAAIGVTQGDIDGFCAILANALHEVNKKADRGSQGKCSE